MATTQLAEHLTAARKAPSPNVKTALRLCDAWISYSDETLKTAMDECVADSFVWNALPESLSTPGWNQLNKAAFIEAFRTAWWAAIKGMQLIVTDLVESENNVILYTKFGPGVVSVEGKPVATSHVHGFRFNADGKVVEQNDFLDTKWMTDFWGSEPQKTIVATGGNSVAAGGNR
ncbi:uncharacterized protein EI90DRAFT_3048708 [Cantharellus anzutake]|uniref:uncharacterized protein n=1 Tax=Cantharellus anzutake TaxID=1750568 RepID=UPI0019072F49|nr:uncharacterized protein EI90DRAFT_3087159 [Cantharellus anzutake]XP_038918309.1 uncharacterized protein EI90DRAFT_3048708 [Cantharellus anzutake]KAF8316013.1 hypothetical protein EI90DRAFT_3087159 [Cantharellus anzutake]KAF8334881.1 hypothetical protein EI90DRAFT_3048708 [Cantharellus anzutake]